MPFTEWLPLLLPDTEIDSSPSTSVSCTGVSSNQASPADAPFGIVILPTFDVV